VADVPGPAGLSGETAASAALLVVSTFSML
jgi:hypothetical protein